MVLGARRGHRRAHRIQQKASSKKEHAMKTLALLTLAAAALLPAHATTNIGVSIGINAPGHYGRIDIDNYPQPRLYALQPIVIAPSPVAIYQRPIYMYVPQAHQTNWGRYCNSYRACGQPVVFVQESWVRDEYRRESDERRHGKKAKGRDHHDGNGHDRGRGKGQGKHDD
jgi:hypothetical protein